LEDDASLPGEDKGVEEENADNEENAEDLPQGMCVRASAAIQLTLHQAMGRTPLHTQAARAVRPPLPTTAHSARPLHV
jgi:hypothetical protein